MIGQKRLLERINSYTIDTFPRSAIFIGDQGCGKHTLVNYIAENIIKLPVIDITDNLSNDLIDAIYRNPNPNIYIIDLNKLTEKSQNVILKFVEEPLNNSFIMLLCDNKNYILNTVLNRCIIFEFEKYTYDELKTFLPEINLDKNIVINALKTPGKLKSINVNTLNGIVELSLKIIDKLQLSNIGNALTISNYINFKDEYDKFDLNIFLDILSYLMYNRFLTTNDKVILEMYKKLAEQRKSMLDLRIDKRLMFEHLLIDLWKGVKYDSERIKINYRN